MLISITNSCHMGCNHCMDDAKPCDEHMSMDTLKDVMAFCLKVCQYPMELVITGGEPTDHPQWMEMLSFILEYVKRLPLHVTLTTNGMNIVNNEKAQKFLLQKRKECGNGFNVQITSVKEYYPTMLDFSEPFFTENKDFVILCDYLEGIYPIGRARTNNLPWKSKGSKCFNIRSIVRNTHSLRGAIVQLILMLKFCTPQIDINGNIKLGESRLCPVASNIYKTEEEIVEDICNFTCSGCDIINNKLSKEHLKAIGEI